MTWYSDGLRFSCTRCGNCCSGDSGSVRVRPEESAELARGLELRDEEFAAMYTDLRDDGTRTLRERQGGDCVFFDSKSGCRVYANRPRQCRTWPFWRGVVSSEARWRHEARHCPGMDQGQLFDAETILALTREDGTSGQIPATPDPETR